MEEHFDAEIALNELSNIIGIKEPIKSRILKKTIRKKKIESIVDYLALQFGLPVKISIVWVKNLNMPAQVNIPSNLPFFGSPKLHNYIIEIKIRSSLQNDSYVLPMIIAHEIAHILLHSLNFRYKNSEKYTDIAAILMGFQEIFRSARKITFETSYSTSTTTYGYLSDEQFITIYSRSYSYLRIEKEIKRKLFQTLSKLKRQQSSYQNNIKKLKNYLDYLDNHREVKISKKNSKRISFLFYPNTVIEMDVFNMKILDKIEMVENSISPLIHYVSDKNLKNNDLLQEIERLSIELNEKNIKLIHELNMLQKYCNPFNKFFRCLV